MKRRFSTSRIATDLAALFATLFTAFFAEGASAVTLYDPGLATLPSAQQWSTFGIGSISQSLTGGSYRLSTAPIDASRAGSIRLAPFPLDTQAGFTLDFGLRIASESHAADNQRAGFSLIVTGADPARSLELGFWQDEVFAYDAGFAPGSAAAFDTTAVTAYSLLVGHDGYRLTGNGAPLLSGSLVDYTGLNLAPYTSPNVLFFGDDTSRAQSVSELGAVRLTLQIPEPATAPLLIAGLFGLFARIALAGRHRRRPE